MKLIWSFYLCLLCATVAGQQIPEQLWKQTFYSIDSFKIEMSHYQGKPLILAMLDAGNPDKQALRLLDSINKAPAPNFSVIGIPLTDFNMPRSKASLLKMLRDSSAISFPLTGLGRAKNDSGMVIHMLIKWLSAGTDKMNHYKVSIDDAGQFFFIDAEGKLYAILGRQALNAPGLLKSVLSASSNHHK